MDGKKRYTTRCSFKWEIPFHEYLDILQNINQLKDEDVIRGILALFFGASCSRMYETRKHEITVKDDVRMEGASRQESADWLGFYANYGEKMSGLMELLYPDVEHSDVYEYMSNTLNGYLVTLRQIVHQAVRILVTKSGDLLGKKSDGSVTRLHTFRQFMQSTEVASLLKTISFLHVAHDEVLRSEDFFYNYRSTPLLVNIFHQHLLLSASHSQRRIAWNLFLSTLRPTLFYLDDLLEKGHTIDLQEEFMFDLGDTELNTDPDFWEKCLELKSGETVPLVLKPLIDCLMLGIRSRLLLLQSGVDVKRQKLASTFDQFYRAFTELQSIPDEEDEENEDEKETDCRCQTPDSGEGGELDENTDSRSTSNDVSDNMLLTTETPAPVVNTASRNSVDEGIGQTMSLAIDFGPGQLRDLMPLQFTNITPLDSIYIENRYAPVQVYNPDLDHLPEFDDALVYDLPEWMRTPMKLAIERSLFPALRTRCDVASADLLQTFRPSYTRHLKFHTDYWLLHRDSHNISLYLDQLFKQVTSKDEQKYLIFSSYNLHDDSDDEVRACILYSHKPSDMDSPIKILNRLHIQYREMDAFSRLLLSPQVRQIFADAFHFLIVLKYSKWLLCTVNLRHHLNQVKESGDEETGDERLLFAARFRCLKAVTRLLEYVMFELHEAIVTLEKETANGQDFDQLKKSLTVFTDIVKKTTMSDKDQKGKHVSDMVFKAAVRIQRMNPTTNESLIEMVRTVEKVVALLCDRSVDH